MSHRIKCGCLIADSKDRAVKKGYELGGYVKEFCVEHSEARIPVTSYSREILSWFDSNTAEPEVGALVLTRNRQLSYGGDLYSYELMRMDADKHWYHQDYKLMEAQPDEWSELEVKVK